MSGSGTPEASRIAQASALGAFFALAAGRADAVRAGSEVAEAGSLVAIIAVAVLAVIGAGAFFFMKSRGAAPIDDDVPEVPATPPPKASQPKPAQQKPAQQKPVLTAQPAPAPKPEAPAPAPKAPVAEPDEPVVETAQQSTTNNPDEAVVGKTIALSSVDFEEMLRKHTGGN
ncbi:MAG: hypothetical protein H6697_00285 [Myxococcales bacterium]|nr:hypothetical protein [Myxococcales bacterium]MCB9520054.1 hypothetical protein [Myxococcales bacterium]